MSEQGWKEFLAAEGVDDWVVLHGGATAAFRAGSISEAARLAAAVAEVPGFEGSGALLTIAGSLLTVRLTRDLWVLEASHVDLARAVSAVAREHGAVANRASVQEVQLAISAKPDALDVGFWRAVLGYASTPMADDNGVDPLGHGSTVWMQELDEAKPLRHAMHLDVSVAREQAEARLAAALAAGGRIVTDGGMHWTLADRAGNRVCITAWPDGKPPPDEAA
jgi:4a-hydroxytetrahydrobiopterin dehydratase